MSVAKLSEIYRGLLIDLGALYNFEPAFRDGVGQQAIECVSGAVGQALAVTSSRCEICDGTNVALLCSDCMTQPTK